MKTDRKVKAEKDSPVPKAVKSARRVTPKTNGIHPLAAYEHIPIGIMETSLEGNYVDVNEEFCRILGYSRDELLRLGVKDCTHEDDYAIDSKLYEQLIAGRIPFYRLEKRYVRKNGDSIWVELTRTLVCDEKERPLYTMGVVLDISDRKDVERVLRESVERLRLATASARMFMWEWDLQKDIYTVDDNFEKVIGFSGGLLPKDTVESVQRLMPPEDRQLLGDALSDAIARHADLHSLQVRFIDPASDRMAWLEINGKIVYDEEGNALRIIGATQNITQNKKIQDEIKFISRMPEENPNPVMRLTPGGEVIYANGPTRVMLDSWKVQGTQTIPDELRMSLHEVHSSGFKKEIEIRQNDRIFSCTLAPIQDGGYVNFYGNDITARKRAEEALRSSEERMRLAIEANRMVAWEWDPINDHVITSENVADVYGLDSVENATAGFSLIWSDDLPAHREKVEQVTREGGEYHSEFRVTRPVDGQVLWMEERATAIMDTAGRVTRLVGVVTDVTERKQAEEKLRESEERFRALVNQATAGIAQSDPDSRLKFVNPKFCEMLGYSEEELLGKTIWELTYTEDVEENKRLFDRMMTEGKSYQFEKRFIRKDGSMRWTNVSVTTVHDSSGQPTGGVGVMIDIEERKQAEKSLQEFARQQEALYRLSEQLHEAGSLTDVYDASLDAILSALQCDRASILLFDHKDVMRFVAWRGLSEEYRKATDGHSPWTPDAKAPQPISIDDVRTADLEESLRAVIQGEGIGALAFIPLVVNEKLIGKFMIYYDAPHTFQEAELDLSLTIAHQLAFGVDRNRTEHALARERETLARLFETMPVMVSMIDPETNAMRMNAEFERLLGWRSDEVTVLSLLEALYPDVEYRNEVLQRMAAAAGKNEWVEVRVQARDGRTVDSLWSNISIFDGQKLVTGIALGIDITERKQAEEKIRRLNNDLQAQLDEMNSLLEILPTGVWIGNEDCSEIVGNPAAYRMLELPVGINASVTTAEPQTPTGMRLFVEGSEVNPDNAPMQTVARSGKPMHNFEHEIRFQDGTSKTIYASIVPLFDREGAVRKVIGAYTDMTDHKQAEKRLLLMTEISDMLRNVEDPHELLYRISEVLGEHLNVKRVLFNEIDLEHDLEIVHRDYHRGLASVAGVHKVSAYSSVTSAEVAAGKTVVNIDSKLDPRTAQDYEKTYAVSGERSYVVVPMMRENRWVASLWVSDDQPRVWTKDEVSLLETIAERTWTVIEKLRINAELRESEERLRAMLETTVVGFATLTTDTRFVEVNDAFCQIVGYSREELLGMDCSVLTHPYYQESTNHHVAQLLAGQISSFVLEKIYIRKDGVQIWVQNSVSVMHDTDGKPVSLVVICQDVTERKGMEEQLRLRERELEEIINETPFMLTRCTRDMRYRFVSRAYAEMIGRTPEELEGKPIVEIMGQEGLSTISPHLERVLAGERVEYEAEVSFQNVGVPFLHIIYTPDRDEQGNVIGWFASIVDISERKRAEEALRIENERFMQFVNSNIVGILIGNAKGEVVLANDYYLRLLGVSQQEFKEGKVDWKKFTPPEWLPADEKAIQELREHGTCEPYEKEYVRADGTRVSVYIADAMLPGPGQEIAAFVLDISERKRAEEALRQSEERYRGIVNQTIGGIAETDLDGNLIMVNDRYCEITGYTRQQLLSGMRMQDLTYPDDLPKNIELFGRLRVEGDSFEIEKRYIRSDGSVVWVHTSVSAITGTDGKPRSAVAAVIDVTERRRSEEALRASESLYRAIARNIPGGGVYVVDKDFRYLVAEGPVTEAFGLSRQTLEGRTVTEVFPDERGKRMEERLRQNLAGETVSFETQHQGRVYWTQQAPLHDSLGHVIILTLDITERKQAEEALRESEERFRNMADHAPVMVWVTDANGACSYLSQSWYEFTGQTPETGLGYGWLEAVHPDDKAEAESIFLASNVDHKDFRLEYRIRRVDGVYRWAIDSAQPRFSESGEFLGYIGSVIDITERKQAEEALRQSEERFARFMQHLPGLAWIKDMEGRYVYANAAAEKAFNAPREKLYGKKDEDLFPSEIAEQFRGNDEQALRDEKGVQVIETLEHADGVIHSSLVSKFPIPGSDASTTLIGGTAVDITERLRAEEALRESEERFRAILRQATAGIVRKDAEGRMIFVNQAFCNMLGYTEADLLGKTMWDFMHEEDIAQNKRWYERLLQEGIPFKLERRLLREDGSIIWVDASVSPIMDATGRPQSAVTVEVDITARKLAEEALQQLNLQLEERVLSRTAKLRSVNQTLREEITERKKIEEALRNSEAAARANEEKLSTLFKLLPVGISFLDPEGQIIEMNPALAHILKLSPELLSDQAEDARKYIRSNGTFMPSSEFASRRALTEGKTVYNVETGVVLEDQQVIWTSVSAAPVDVAEVGAVVVTADITESKRAEQALQESRERLQILSQRLVEVQEEERRAIARELHDRVGQTLAALNINLIIISGQLGGKVEEQVSTRLNDSMKLVAETIALVRDVMSNLRPSVLDDYGLEAALDSHLSQYTSRYEIQVKFEKPKSSIPRMVPGIEMTFLRIAQEALMNIARHARASQVNLALWQENDAVCMTIQDNGMGITSWQDANRPGSHGLTIMRERAEAFGGSLRVNSVPGKGTKVEVRIPLEMNDASPAKKEMDQ